MWQNDFAYYMIIGWSWVYLSTVLDDFLRSIIAWKLCSNLRDGDVTDTLDVAMVVSGYGSATALHKPRLLSDNGPSFIRGKLADYIKVRKISYVRGAPISTPRSRRSSSTAITSATMKPERRNARRRLLRRGTSHPQPARKDQATDHRAWALATPHVYRLYAATAASLHSQSP